MTVAETGSPALLHLLGPARRPGEAPGLGGRPGRGLRVGDRPRATPRPWASRRTAGSAARPPAWWGPSPRGTSPTRSTWPSWVRPWPPATPSCSSRRPTRPGAPPCSAGSSPRRPTSRRVWSTSSPRPTTASVRCCRPTPGWTRSASPAPPPPDRRSWPSAADSLKKVFLELGGKSAFVVLDDADLRGACATAAFTVCTHAGQGCAITTRLLVPRRQFDEAVESTAKVLAQAAGRRPDRPGHHLRAADQRPPARPGRGLPAPGPGGGRHGRRRRRPARGARPRLLRRAHPDRRAGQRGPGGPGGDLRAGARGHPPRRRRRRRGPGQRLALRVCPARCGRPTATGPSAWPAASAPAPSGSTAVCGTAPTCPSAGYKQSGIGREMGVAGFEEYLETKSMAEPA